MTCNDIFSDNYPQELKDVAHRLRTLALKTDKRIEEHIYGGAKVRMALYSIGHTDNVLFGIGLGKDHIKLYLHHTEKVETETLKLEGKGKHAKTVKIKATSKDNLETLKRVMTNIRDAANY